MFVLDNTPKQIVAISNDGEYAVWAEVNSEATDGWNWTLCLYNKWFNSVKTIKKYRNKESVIARLESLMNGAFTEAFKEVTGMLTTFPQ